MEKTWQDFGLWLPGLVVMGLGIIPPILLFYSEGTNALFGTVVYVFVGILLFPDGLGITCCRARMRANSRLYSQG